MTWTPRAVDKPEPGFFRLRLIKGGPWVPAQIRRVGTEWHATIAGVLSVYQSELDDSCPSDAVAVWRIWHGGKEINEDDYQLMLQRMAWARRDMPDHPAANPDKPVDMTKLPSLF